MNKEVNFKYRGYYLFNIVAILLLLLFVLITYLIIKSNKILMYKILFIALVSILLFTWMFIISKKLSIITGSFIFDTDVFYYETLRKSYEINYNEVAYISKEYRIDGNSFFNLERIIYRIKIKDAGSFVYYYEDDSLVKAINVLAKKLDMKIIDKTKE